MDIKLLVTVVGVLIGHVARVTSNPKINSELAKSMEKKDCHDVIIKFTSCESVIEQVNQEEIGLVEKRNKLRTELKTFCGDHQSEVKEILEKERQKNSFFEYYCFWVTNCCYVSCATAALIRKLAACSRVVEVHEEIVMEISPPAEAGFLQDISTRPNATNAGYGIRKIGADKCWEKGATGFGVKVASIDSGVRWTHEILRDNYAGPPYGWYDGWGNGSAPEPNDINGHGTYTMGTICGQKGIGVAPDATWMSCRACNPSCPQSACIKCAQFMLAPTYPNGSFPDASQSPDVINHSWTSSPTTSTDWFGDVIKAYGVANIKCVWSAGNNGVSCDRNTLGYPANKTNVIAVGASDENDMICWFSSCGSSDPANFSSPFCLAPGNNVYSSWCDSDNSYATNSGTSIAAPHVTGGVALMLDFRPGSTMFEIQRAIEKSTLSVNRSQDPTACNGVPLKTRPNNCEGNGIFNVFGAISALAANQAS